MIGRSLREPSNAADARIERQARELRKELADMLVAVEDLRGFRPGEDGTPFSLSAGTRLPREHWIVGCYRRAFRPLTAAEIEIAIKGAVASWRFGAGL